MPTAPSHHARVVPMRRPDDLLAAAKDVVQVPMLEGDQRRLEPLSTDVALRRPTYRVAQMALKGVLATPREAWVGDVPLLRVRCRDAMKPRRQQAWTS